MWHGTLKYFVFINPLEMKMLKNNKKCFCHGVKCVCLCIRVSVSAMFIFIDRFGNIRCDDCVFARNQQTAPMNKAAILNH